VLGAAGSGGPLGAILGLLLKSGNLGALGTLAAPQVDKPAA
jgi:hypothetical protein